MRTEGGKPGVQCMAWHYTSTDRQQLYVISRSKGQGGGRSGLVPYRSASCWPAIHCERAKYVHMTDMQPIEQEASRILCSRLPLGL